MKRALSGWEMRHCNKYYRCNGVEEPGAKEQSLGVVGNAAGMQNTLLREALGNPFQAH